MARWHHWYDRLPPRLQSLLAPLLLLAGWRLLSLFAALLVEQFSSAGPPTKLSELLVRSADRWDAGWYLAIARDGYALGPENTPHHANIAFYPLLPLLIKFAHLMLPSWRLAGLVVVHLALIGAVCYLVALVRLDYDQPTALRATLALLVYPTAIFLTTIYTEPLLLLALLGATYHARRGQWLRAGLWGVAAGLTKTIGLIAIVPIVVEAWQLLPWQRPYLARLWKQRGTLWRPLAALLLTGIGAIAYPLYLIWRFGSLQVYTDTQIAWFRYGWFQPFLADGWGFLQAHFAGRDYAVINYFYPPGSITLPTANTFMLLDLLLLLCALITGVLILWRVRRSYGLLVIAGAVLSAYSGSPQSLNRYTLVLFPCAIGAALVGRRPGAGFALFLTSSLLWLFHLYLFANGHWAG